MLDPSLLSRDKQIRLLEAYRKKRIFKARKPHPLFMPLYESDKRYYLLTGGRGSLKSSEVHKYVIKSAQKKGHGILFTRYTMSSAEKSIIPEFKIVAERMGVLDEFEITRDKAIHKESQSFIHFSGIKVGSKDQTANLKSIAGITIWVIEEGEEFDDEETFDAINLSVRSNKHPNKVIWIQNPSTKEHFIYKKWIQDTNKKIDVHGYDVTVSSNPRIEHIHLTYHIAMQYLEESWLDDMEEEKAKAESVPYEDRHKTKYYYKYIGGWLEKAIGVIIENWIEGDMDESLPYCYGMDFGYNPDPSTLVEVAVDQKRKKIYIQEHLYKTKLKTKPLVAIVRDRIYKPDDLIVADSSEQREIIEMREDYDLNIIKAYKPPGSVKATLKEFEDYQFIVCGDSPNLKIELNNYIWNDKKAGIPIDKFNHLIDPTRYAYDKLTGKYMQAVNDGIDWE